MITYLRLKHDTFGVTWWPFWGNYILGLGTKGPHSDPANKIFLGLCIVSSVSKWSNLVKNGVKTCVSGYFTICLLLLSMWLQDSVFLNHPTFFKAGICSLSMNLRVFLIFHLFVVCWILVSFLGSYVIFKPN